MPLKQRFECGRCGSEVSEGEKFYDVTMTCSEHTLDDTEFKAGVMGDTKVLAEVTIGECCKPTIDALIAKMKSGRKARKPRVKKPTPKSKAPNTTGNDFKGRRGETVTA